MTADEKTPELESLLAQFGEATLALDRAARPVLAHAAATQHDRWLAAHAIETCAELLRERWCLILREAEASKDDARLLAAARNYMAVKARAIVAKSTREAAQEVTAFEWQTWAAQRCGEALPAKDRQRFVEAMREAAEVVERYCTHAEEPEEKP